MRQRLLTFVLATTLFAAILSAPPVAAQDEAMPVEVPRYSVEIILFRYGAGVPSGNERFLPDKPPLLSGIDGELQDGAVPVFGDRPETRLPSGTAEQAMQDLQDPPFDIELAITPRDQLALRDVYDKLQRLDAYEPLLWTGWSQLAVEAAAAPEIPLQRLGTAPANFDGSLQLYLSRFLHLVVDLTMTEQPDGSRMDTSNRLPQSVRLRINEDRIMKNGDLRYYDHPKFGLLAKVVRLEQTVPSGARAVSPDTRQGQRDSTVFRNEFAASTSPLAAVIADCVDTVMNRSFFECG